MDGKGSFYNIVIVVGVLFCWIKVISGYVENFFYGVFVYVVKGFNR